MHKLRKAQAAMEFLMTYGWAIIAAIVVIAAIGYLLLSPDSSVLQSDYCLADPPFTCQGVDLEEVNGVKQLTLEIKNSGADDTKISEVEVDNCEVVNSFDTGVNDTISVTNQTSIERDNLIAWYRYEFFIEVGSNQFFDYYNNSHDADIGQAQWITYSDLDYKEGLTSADFYQSSPSYGVVPSHADFTGIANGGFSVCAWAKKFTAADDSAGSDDYIFYAGTSGSDHYGSDFYFMRVNVATDELEVGVSNGYSDSIASISQTDGVWGHYCMVVVNAENMTLYKDEAYADHTDLGIGLGTIPGNFVMAALYSTSDGYNHYYRGLMDSLAVFDSPLTHSQVSEVYKGNVKNTTINVTTEVEVPITTNELTMGKGQSKVFVLSCPEFDQDVLSGDLKIKYVPPRASLEKTSSGGLTGRPIADEYNSSGEIRITLNGS